MGLGHNIPALLCGRIFSPVGKQLKVPKEYLPLLMARIFFCSDNFVKDNDDFFLLLSRLFGGHGLAGSECV